MTPDLINGLFEAGGAVTLCLNVRALWRDRGISGVHWGPVAFFSAWGLWNLIYYPSLHQWFSFAGGLLVVTINLVWLGLLAWFVRDRLYEIRCPVDPRYRWAILAWACLATLFFVIGLLTRGH